MHNPNAAGYNPEIEQHNPEAFMPLDSMQHLVGDTLIRSGRVDEQGIIQPLSIAQYRISNGFERLEPITRTDIFIPTANQATGEYKLDDGTEIAYQLDKPGIEPAFYGSLTHSREGVLDIDVVEALAQSGKYLEEVVGRSIDYKLTYTTEQGLPAFFIRSQTEPPKEIASTRVYIPGGLDAMAIAAGIVSKGAEFDVAKMWVPEMKHYKQTLRDDTPIFQVSSFKQLQSVVGALRNMKAEGRLPAYAAPLVGYEIPGLPGVFVGQCDTGESFNGRMKKLFVPALEQAAQDFDLGAGDQVTDEMLIALSRKTRQVAMQNTEPSHTHPAHHAFLDDQPVGEIMASVAA